jgi:hypothetical protein
MRFLESGFREREERERGGQLKRGKRDVTHVMRALSGAKLHLAGKNMSHCTLIKTA